MEEKNIINKEELDKVNGGTTEKSIAAYDSYGFCEKCNAHRKITVYVETTHNREKHICKWNSSHFWYVNI